MRLVTRGDLDGLVSAVLISTMEPVDSLELIHPQQITDGRFEVREGDILSNLPYHPACALWFDHHELTGSNRRPPASFRGMHALRPSVSRVVFEYYRSEKLVLFEPLVAETDRFDSAQLGIDDISDARGAVLLGFMIDPRTGLGIDKRLFADLVERLKTGDVETVLKMPEMARRVALYRENDIFTMDLLKNHSRLDGNVIVSDLRNVEKQPVGNRFLIYLIHPEGNVSVRAQWGPGKEFVAVTIGHSILNRTCAVDIGCLCGDFGGGGHYGAGACILKPEEADRGLKEIVRRLKTKAPKGT